MKRKTYTIHEFLTNEHHKELKKIDQFIGHIKRNKKLYLQLIVILAFIGLNTGISFADGIATTLAKIDRAGNNFLRIAKGIGYWAILIKGVTEVIKSGMEGDKETAVKIVLRYVLIYAVLFFFPVALRMVEEVF